MGTPVTPQAQAPFGQPPYGQPPGAQPQGGLTADERTWGMLCHLGTFLGGPILPIVALVSRGKESPFVRGHAAAALDNQITQFIVIFGVMLLTFGAIAVGAAGMAATAGPGQGAATQGAFGVGMGLFQCVFCVAFIYPIVGTVFAIMGAIAANRGDVYNYPGTFRIIR
jgi:uncharacterized Tic20 family protein